MGTTALRLFHVMCSTSHTRLIHTQPVTQPFFATGGSCKRGPACASSRGMTIKFLLLVNKQGQTRLAKYFTELLSTEEKRALEGEIVRKCLARTDKQCSFYEHRSYKIIYRRYASLFFMVGVDDEENELAVLELIHCFVEVLDKHFGQVCELDIMNDPDVVHYIMDEMLLNGCIVDTNKQNILEPVQLLENVAS